MSVPGIGRDVQAVMNRVGRAGRHEADVRDRSRRPGIALVDRVAVRVELKAAIEMRTRLDRSFPTVSHGAAVQQDTALVVDRFELDPDVEGVHGAAREEMTDLPGADDDLDPDGFSSTDRRRNLVERASTSAGG